MLNKLIVSRLNKNTGFKKILFDINFNISKKQLLVITGPNGSGKTTLIRIIAGLISDYTGKIIFKDEKNNKINKNEIIPGYLGHSSMIYEEMTVEENINFFTSLYGKFNQDKQKKLLQRYDLYLYRYEPAGNLSRGMKQRLSLIRLNLLDPVLILYDEPFTGLDESGQILLNNYIKKQKKSGKIQILITHNLKLLEDIKYQKLQLKEGQIISRDYHE
ncbi:MAG: ABC transporter ATP-binding protein [Bacillota bacterium]